MKKLLKLAGAIAAVYVVLVGGLFLAMLQPPQVFGRIMRVVAKGPGIAFLIIPFRPLWFIARKGRLNVGDPAPDFSLWTADKKTQVTLSSFRGKEPVVLVFGSYT